MVLKAPEEVSSASLQSPHDPDATYNARKGKGYEVQIAETCHPDNRVQVITHVELTEACARDAQATMPILEDLVERDQQPQELVADTAYGSAENAVDAERLGTELVSPVSGRAVAVEAEAPEERPLTSADFHVDVRGEDPAVCPGGHFSTEQTPHATHPYRLTLTFDRPTCEDCPLFHRCPAPRHASPDGCRVVCEPGRGQSRAAATGPSPRPVPAALPHPGGHRGHQLGTETAARIGDCACARATPRDPGRLHESPGLQRQENAARLQAGSGQSGARDGLKAGPRGRSEGLTGPRRRPLRGSLAKSRPIAALLPWPPSIPRLTNIQLREQTASPTTGFLRGSQA